MCRSQIIPNQIYRMLRRIYLLLLILIPLFVMGQNNAAFKNKKPKLRKPATAQKGGKKEKVLSERQEKRLTKKKLKKGYEFKRSKEINKRKVRKRMEKNRKKAIKKSRQKALRNRPANRNKRW